MVAMELIRELIRVLYHLDLFRRHVRNGTSINLHSIKGLFSTLSDAMRDPSIQPQTLTKILENSRLLHELDDKAPGDAYNFISSTLMQDANAFATNYSLTKVCLTCSTCSHEESVVKYLHHVDSSLLSSTDYPSFEFSLKTSLNTNEFCQKINCFGELKIFRVLKQEPSILALDFEQGTPLSTLPPLLKPYLIFNSTSSSELYLTSVLLSNPPATLFYHTRLFTWIYTSEETIIPLNTPDWNQVLLEPLLSNSTVVLAFFTYCYPMGLNSPTPVITAPLPPLPVPSLTHQHSNASMYTHLGRCGSSVSGNSSIATTTSCSMPIVATSPTSTTSSPAPSLFLLHERIYENWPLDNDSGHGSIEPNNSIEDGSCSASTSSGGSSGSGSSRNSAHTAISTKNSSSNRKGCMMIPGSSSNNRISECIYSSSKAIPGSSCPTTSSNSSATTTNGIMMNYATIKRRRHNRAINNKAFANGLTSVSVPDLTLDFKKVVSFNCKVTLVDDCNDEEYIPHPIFEKVLEKMRKQQ